MGNSLAKFCGKFEDKHKEPDSEFDADDDDVGDLAEEEDGSMLPKDYAKIKRDLLQPPVSWLQRLRGVSQTPDVGLKNLQATDAVAIKMWVSKTTTVSVEEDVKGGGTINRRAPAIIVGDNRLSKVMLKKLRTFQNMHTIELINCGLKECPPGLVEIEALRVVRFSNNQIRQIRKDLTRSAQNKFSSLQRIILDNNQIEMVELGTLSEDAIQALAVLDFGKNQLRMLPIDFCNKGPVLEILDLSFNKLQGLPDSIMECVNLRILDVCNNDLRALPERLDKLKKLRKLFVNTNKLAELPELIGECKKLEKLWVSGNCLRYLPYSVIPLWKGEGGLLEEIMVDDNPLVLPSVTAFQMGGPNQMFRLFKEHVEEEKRRKEMVAIADAPDREERRSIGNANQAALRDSAGPDDEGNVDADEEGHASAARPSTETHALCDEDDAVGDDGLLEEAEETAPLPGKKAADWYFAGHLGGRPEDFEFLSKVRTAESSLMMLKRQIYVDQIKKLAETRSNEAKKDGKPVSKKVEKYLDPAFSAQSFKGNVHITDLDLFFTMFAMTAKSLSATCEMLFNKFTPGGDMDRKAWDHFCARVPVKLPEELKSSMFRLLTWRQGADPESAQADIVDFIAAMHIHDISSQLGERDPFVTRIAQVLKLKYYTMSMSDFETKIKSRGHDSSNALECIDFPSEDDAGDDELPTVDEENKDSGAEDSNFPLPSREGDRFMASAAQEALQKKGQGANATQNAKKRKPNISMTEAQYNQESNDDQAEEADDVHDTAFEISSTDLSQEDDSDESFDADDDCLEELRKIEQEEKRATKTVSGAKQQFQVTTGDDLDALMKLPPKEIVGAPVEEDEAAEAMVETAAKEKKEKFARDKEKKRQKQLASMAMLRDPRFGTNVMTVRRAIRDVYRNLPYHDFVALVNFLLRGLQHIKHFPAAQHITFWHADDPIMRHLMGNSYATEVLRQMGFVRVFAPEDDVSSPDCLSLGTSAYWVWPEKHFDLADKHVKKLVPSHCPGLEKTRLDDLIKLIRHCRKSLDKALKGTKFTGHCRAS